MTDECVTVTATVPLRWCDKHGRPAIMCVLEAERAANRVHRLFCEAKMAPTSAEADAIARVRALHATHYEPAYVDVNVRDDVSELVTALTDAIGSEHEELEAERAKVARVRELHRPTPNIAECGIERGCTKCRSEWPCETILALDSEETK